MRIGIDASRANSKFRTGTEWYSFYLIKYLAKIDQENEYLLYVNKKPLADLQDLIRDHPNFRVKRLIWPWRIFWSLGRLSWEMLFRAPDVLFVPAHSLPLIHPKRTVNTIHDIAFMYDAKLYQCKQASQSSRQRSFLLNFLTKIFTRGKYGSNSLDHLFWSTKRSLKRSWKIIAVSNSTKKDLISVYTNKYEEKIKVVHNGYPEELYPAKDNLEKQEEILKKHGLLKPFFLYVGRLEKKKNVATLLEAFARFKETYNKQDYNLALVGSAGYAYDELKYIIEDNNLDRFVFMPGWLDEQDLPYIFQAATAFVFPSFYEGFGIPVLQAMASKLPCIVSDIPVLREILGDSCLYFDPKNPEDLSMALIKVLEDQDLRENLIEKGLENLKNYSWEKSAKETLEILKGS